LGREVTFFLNGGEVGETVVVTLTMADSLKNIKHDTIQFKCIAPIKRKVRNGDFWRPKNMKNPISVIRKISVSQ